MESKSKTGWIKTSSLNRALALFVALGMVTSAATLFANDQDDKDKTRDNPTSAQSRDRNPAAHEQEDLNAKTDPEKFIRSVSECSVNEIRLGNMAKQRAQNQE